MGQAESKSEATQVSGGWFQKWRKDGQGKSVGRSQVLQLVLVGPRGSGKSLMGNHILGSETFKPGTKTVTCQTASCQIGDRALTVVDTPGFTGKQYADQKVMWAITEACQDLLELPVIFLLVVPLEWNGEMAQGGKHMLRHVIGKVSLNHMMVLVTHTDQDELEEDSILRKGGLLQLIVGQCGGRFQLFNTDERDGTQVLGLLDKVDRMLQEGKKTQDPDASLEGESEESAEESAEESHQCKAPNQESQRTMLKAEPHTPEQDCNKGMGTETLGVMHLVKKNLQKLKDRMKRKREEEEKLARERNIQYKAQLQQIREKMRTVKTHSAPQRDVISAFNSSM